MAGSARTPTHRPHIDQETLLHQMQIAVDDWHHKLMITSMGKDWTRVQVTQCFLDCLKINGFDISDQEMQAFPTMQDEDMARELTEKIPYDMRETFEQLSKAILASACTAARIRDSLDNEADDNQTDKIMDAEFPTDCGQQVLRLGVVQASSEVRKLMRCQETWWRSMEKRLNRLQAAAEVAERAHSECLAIEAQLDEHMGKTKENGKQVLLGLAEGNAKTLMHTAFSAWLGIHVKCMAEAKIRAKFQAELEEAENEFFRYKEKQLAGVRNTMMRNARDGDSGLMSVVFLGWKQSFLEDKRDGTSKAAMAAIEGKMAAFQDAQKEKSKKVMARMNANQDGACVTLAFQAWMKFSEEYKKDKEFEDSVKNAERQWKEHMAKKKEEATTVVNSMNATSEQGLLQMIWTNWMQFLRECRDLRKVEDAMSGHGDQFKAMRDRQSGNAQGVQTRVNDQAKANLMLTVLGRWAIEARINRMDKYYRTKIDGKRKQLSSVQSLFTSFARQLEEGLGGKDGGESSGRGPKWNDRSRGPPGKVLGRFGGKDFESNQDDDGTVSLPDIHKGKRAA